MRDGSVVNGHDDWSCIQDMCEAGILAARTEDGYLIGGEYVDPNVRLVLTSLGEKYSNALRAHKRNGGRWSNFDPSVVV